MPQPDSQYQNQEIAPPTAQEYAKTSYRIRRCDRHNWQIEKWVKAGSGPKGRVSRGAWKGDGYFPQLEQAAQGLLDRLLLSGEEYPGIPELIEAVRRAHEYVAACVKDVLGSQKT
jgi:hypothetical protein